MYGRLILLCLLPLTVLAASKPAPKEEPIVLPDKYAPIFYEHLQGKEKERCEKYVGELTMMEKRKRMGMVQNWDKEKMEKKQQKIAEDYDRYCLRLQK
ncbi:hypothetical protein [Chitinimonas sp.]|uniref:hypothetical protein n=1 Tax=Chitinimonas sp. TaxID=1934313 RepID=UPI002F950C9E